MTNDLDRTIELKQLTEQLMTNRESLSEILSEIEETRIKLSGLRHDYYTQIGDIVYKTAIIDTEISRLKRQFELSNSEAGNTTKEDIEQEYTDAKEKIEQEFGDIRKENPIKDSSLSDEDKTELRDLWKKLSKKYHPDLGGSDPETMIKVNKAYERGDIDYLRNLYENGGGDLEELNSADRVRKLLEGVEKSIKQSSAELRKLKLSFWYDLYLQISRSTDKNLFYKELSLKLNKELEAKTDELDKLKSQYDEKQ